MKKLFHVYNILQTLTIIDGGLAGVNNIFAYFKFLTKLEIRRIYGRETLFIDFLSLPSLQEVVGETVCFMGMDIRGKSMKSYFLTMLLLLKAV
jgi:hypothetical protein